MRPCIGLLVGLTLGLSAVSAADPTKVPPELARARLKAARKTYEQLLQRMGGGGISSREQLHLWSCRWRDAQGAVGKGKEEQVAAARDHLDRMKKLEETVTNFVRLGALHNSDLSAAEYYRIQAEIDLAQVKAR